MIDESHFRFSNSNSLIIFSKPLSPESISFVEKPVSFTKETLQHLSGHWLMQLKKKQQQLFEKGILSEVKSYFTSEIAPLDALCVNEKFVMWPGKCITLSDWESKIDSAIFTVSEISYPFITALSDKNFVKNLSDQKLPRLRPALAICTFAITTDNFLVLTVRGISTNVYPGRFYGQGGNPGRADVDLLQHQLEEMEEELLIKPNEVIHDSIKFFGIIEDNENFPGKPDIIGTVQTSISAQQLKERFESRPVDQRPPDVVDIRFIHFDEMRLADFVQYETEAEDFCPPAHGGLLLIGRNYFGESWMKKLMLT